MTRYDLTLKESFIWVKQRRNCIRPNDGFLFQLIDLEKQLREKSEASIKANEVKRITNLYRKEWSHDIPKQLMRKKQNDIQKIKQIDWKKDENESTIDSNGTNKEGKEDWGKEEELE